MAEVSKLVLVLIEDAQNTPCEEVKAIVGALRAGKAGGEDVASWANDLDRTPKIVKDQYAKV